MSTRLPRFATDTRDLYDRDMAAQQRRREMSTEEDRNQPRPADAERQQLVEVGRRTNQIEAAYQTARSAFLDAARALTEHCDRHQLKRDEFEAAGGNLTINAAAEFTEPMRPEPVTEADMQPVNV